MISVECFRILPHEHFYLIDVISSDGVELVIQLCNKIHHKQCSKRETAFLTSMEDRHNGNENVQFLHRSLIWMEVKWNVHPMEMFGKCFFFHQKNYLWVKKSYWKTLSESLMNFSFIFMGFHQRTPFQAFYSPYNYVFILPQQKKIISVVENLKSPSHKSSFTSTLNIFFLHFKNFTSTQRFHPTG